MYFYVRDYLGNILGLVDNSGNIVVKYNYDSYGNNITYVGINVYNPFIYKGYYYDYDIKMYYCHTRFYNPNWRRWLTPDNPYYMDQESISGMNLFAYNPNISTLFCFSLYYSFLIPHRLPDYYPGGGILNQREKSGKLHKKRYYGPNGFPLKDREYTNHNNPNIPNPHDNTFGKIPNGGWGHIGDHIPVDTSTDNPNEGLDWNEDTGQWEKTIKIGAIVVAVVGLIWVIGNDFTGAGAADDAAIPFLVALLGV